MRKLDRSCVSEPECLPNYDYRSMTWDSLTKEDKECIKTKLQEMQGERCAYCEGPLSSLGRHIEHFRRKSHYRNLTFQWDNLFWSCDRKDSCGHYKDHGAGPYSPDDLVNPCIDDPDRYFRFRSNGTIGIRQGLSASDIRSASETLRVFNLDENYGRLRRMRKCAALPYVQAADEILGLDPPDRAEFIAAEIQATEHLPFSSVIRHLFQASL